MSKQEPEKVPPMDAAALQRLAQVAREVAQHSAATDPPSAGPTIQDALRASVGGGAAARRFQEEYARQVAKGPTKW